jgi:hypothetical protein
MSLVYHTLAAVLLVAVCVSSVTCARGPAFEFGGARMLFDTDDVALFRNSTATGSWLVHLYVSVVLLALLDASACTNNQRSGAFWSGHCKRLLEISLDLAAKVGHHTNYAFVNCHPSNQPQPNPICAEESIAGYATLK